MRVAALAVIFALGACASTLPHVVEREGDTFDVRYDAAVQAVADVNAAANGHCLGTGALYLSQKTGFDGFAYRTYRCAAPPARPSTVSVPVSSTSDAEAQRQCRGAARPETVHHESNVITYRCLGGAN
mgnify:CR=1 FL=1